MKKIELGQYYTKATSWLLPQIAEFITSRNPLRIVDPFAGEGDLLRAVCKDFPVAGFDIDKPALWAVNDSLVHIPSQIGDFCLTNPPYLAKTTATRFSRSAALKYFTQYPHAIDLYLIALERCFETFDCGVAIVPETYLLNNKRSARISSLTVLEENPFTDTEFPVAVITWTSTNNADFSVFKGKTYLGQYQDLKKFDIKQKHTTIEPVGIKFNVARGGNIGAICIDNGRKIGGIQFVPTNMIKGVIKPSSRTYTIIAVDTNVDIKLLIQKCNQLLDEYRHATHDIFMAPFKGNDMFGRRRRRLDFATARSIISVAVNELKAPAQLPKVPAKELFDGLENIS